MKRREWWLRLGDRGQVIHAFSKEHLWCTQVYEALPGDIVINRKFLSMALDNVQFHSVEQFKETLLHDLFGPLPERTDDT